MSDLVRVAALDFGGTKILGSVFGYDRHQLDGQPAYRELTSPVRRLTTKGPNRPQEDYRNVREILNQLRTQSGFDVIRVGMAARIGLDGTIMKGGSLKWEERNLARMLQRDYGVPAGVDNDGVMLAAVELVFGALQKKAYVGMSGLIVAPGTGIATSLFLQQDGKVTILPGEGQHGVIDISAPLPPPEERCGCGQHCVESMASGVAYEREGIDPLLLPEQEDVARLAPPIGTYVANLTKFLPNYVQVVVMSGGIPHNRLTFVDAVEAETDRQLCGYVPTPKFVPSKYKAGGVLGCVGRQILADREELN